MRAAVGSDPFDDGGDLIDRERGARDVVHESDGPGTMDENIIDAVVNQIFTDRIEAAGRDRHQQLGSYPVGAQDQSRFSHSIGDPDHPPERTKLASGEGGAGACYQLADPRFGGIRGRKIDPGGSVLRSFACDHARAFARVTWVRSWKPWTRHSTSA